MRSPLMRRLGVAVAAVVVIAGGSTVLAAPASADQVWHQSVGRSSATAECPTTTESEAAIGWTPWTKSWAEWPNDGKGGYVCDRSIVWAKDTPPPGATGAGCVLYDAEVVEFGGGYLDFGGGNFLPSYTEEYGTADCSGEPSGFFSGFNAAYAGSVEEASAICASNLGVSWGAIVPFWDADPRIYVCDVDD